MKYSMVLQPLATEAVNNAHGQWIRREFEASNKSNYLAWRKEFGMCRHAGEYAPIMLKQKNGVAIDIAPIYLSLINHFAQQMKDGRREFLDLSRCFQEKNEMPTYFHPDACHYIDEASEVIAEKVFAWIR